MAWFDDLELPGSTITGYFGFVHEDGPDEDDNPDIRLASGRVRFEPTAPAVKAGGAWIGIAPVEAIIFDGGLIVSEDDPNPPRILSTDADTGVEGWGWRAVFDIRGANIKPVTFKAPTEGVHLTGDLIPVTGQPVEVIHGVRGDSAYDIAVQEGFEGTIEEWLESLHGGPHTHPISDVTGLQAQLDALAAATRSTGRRDIRGDLVNPAAISPGGQAWIQRTGDRVHLSLYDIGFTDSGTVRVLLTLPNGFRPVGREGYSLSISGTETREAVVQNTGLYLYQVPTAGGRVRATLSWSTDNSWPSTYPGDPL